MFELFLFRKFAKSVGILIVIISALMLAAGVLSQSGCSAKDPPVVAVRDEKAMREAKAAYMKKQAEKTTKALRGLSFDGVPQADETVPPAKGVEKF